MFGDSVNEASNAICGLIEAAAQAAYLVGVSDPSSVAGRHGLVDVAQFARANQAIQNVCHQLTNRSSNQEQLLAAATVIAKHTSALCKSCRDASSKTSNPVAKRRFIQSAKDVANATANLVKEIKALDINPSDENRANTATAIKPLIEAVDNLTMFASSPEFASVPAKISLKVDEHHIGSISEGSFVDFQTRMVNSAKEIARLSQEMISKSTVDAAQLGPLAAKLAHQFSSLAMDTRGAIASMPNTEVYNTEVASRIRNSVQDLGTACISLSRSAGFCQRNPEDAYNRQDLANNAHSVSEKVSYVRAALQAGSRGTQACINAASTVSGIIGDLDTTITFATAGTLHAEHENETFSDHRENILKTAKAFVEDTKTLVAGAASSQEQLAVAAQNAVTTIIQLAEVVKLAAASLGSNNPETQVLLINAVKDVATALGDLIRIQATKAASGKSIQDPAMMYLLDSANIMVTNVISLLKTVKAVEDEHSRGTRALESTIEAIGQEIRAYDSSEPPTRSATAEELLRATKPVTLATAKAVAAGNSCKQDDIIVAANMGRKAIFDLLMISKGAAYGSETFEIKHRTLTSSRQCAMHYRELLQMVHQVIQKKPVQDGKQHLINMSRTIASSVSEVVSCAEILKGSDWIDPDDPTVIAETELLGAANSIDAAARKLANLKPRPSIHEETDESLNFDEMILEAAKSITAATSALIKAASAVQRELVASGKVGSQPLYTSDDGQWSEGLISAARLVAAATHSLVEAANALVQGHATEEKLIASAKQVASSTAQLLVACKVKADTDSQSMMRLQSAGNKVKRATDNLVKAAQQAIEHDEERSLIINKQMVRGIAQELVSREEILRKERELEVALEKLAAIRKAKYGNKAPNDYQGYGSN